MISLGACVYAGLCGDLLTDVELRQTGVRFLCVFAGPYASAGSWGDLLWHSPFVMWGCVTCLF